MTTRRKHNDLKGVEIFYIWAGLGFLTLSALVVWEKPSFESWIILAYAAFLVFIVAYGSLQTTVEDPEVKLAEECFLKMNLEIEAYNQRKELKAREELKAQLFTEALIRNTHARKL